MRVLLVAIAVAALAVACSPPPCDPISVVAQSVCLKGDAGVSPGTAFTLFAVHNYSSSAGCTVAVDGGAITLSLFPIAGGGCSASGNGARAPLPPAQPEPCQVPALPAGSYVINTTPTPTAFTLPDAGFAACP